ncbi:MAG: hypothetical protein Q9208_007944 [Pyrenodesmia sp. 3 TL-2023]
MSDDSDAGIIFNCSENFHCSESIDSTGHHTNYVGECLNNQAGCVALFADNSLNIPLDYETLGLALHTSTNRYANPFFAGVFGILRNTHGRPVSTDDPEILSVPTDGHFFVLGCEITVYDFTYVWLNNFIIHGSLTLASDDAAILVRSVLTGEDDSAYSQFAYNVKVATVNSNTSKQVALSYTVNLERTLLAFASPLLVSTPTEQEHTRESLLVTRVPKVPLYTMVSLCLLFVLLGIAVTTMALINYTMPARTVQARLNVFGVITSRFGDPERNGAPVSALGDVFQEHIAHLESTRVGIERTGLGGLGYVSFRKDQGP